MKSNVNAAGRPLRWLRVALVLSALLVAGPAAQAQVEGVHVTLSPYAGWTIWDDGTNMLDKPVFGGRIGLMFNRHVGVEGTYGFIPARTRFGSTMYAPMTNIGDEVGASIHQYGADLILKLGLASALSPYVVGGWQQMDYQSDNPDIVEDNTFSGFDIGAGVIGRLGPRVAMRAEVRDNIITFDSPRALSNDRQNNFFATVGLQFSLGGQTTSDDADSDGVPDSRDTCPNTPLGARVDANGCPIDSDRDGVPDGIDQCASTPTGARVDARGCPTDSDRDGVYDGIDQCADTPAGVTVDARGCPLDADGDGVPDGVDNCPNTPQGARVDANGCPIDSDGDGVFDGLDRCANTPTGVRVDKDGCPIEINERETELLDTGMITVRDINFETAKWNILPASYRILDDIGNILVQWPELRVEIGGHADARGSDAANLELSQKRAQSVLQYLSSKFPDITPAQYTAKGYGESMPVGSNSTVEGMAMNRRVEFKVLNTEILTKERERRRLLQKDE